MREVKVIKEEKMADNQKSETEQSSQLKDAINSLIVLELFKLNISQTEIAKRLHIDIHTVNNLLKGANKG